MLKSIQETASFIKRTQDSVEEFLKEFFQFSQPGISKQEVDKLEAALEVQLPESFSRFVQDYSFSKLSIYYYTFGSGEKDSSYADILIQMNQPEQSPHYSQIKAHNQMIIGSFEQDDILLDLQSGKILLIETDTGRTDIIANNIEELIILITNLYFLNQQSIELADKQKQFIEFSNSNGLEYGWAWELMTASTLSQ